MVKNLPANARDRCGSIPGLGRYPGIGNGNPLQYFLPGKSHGQKSLVGYNPWGHKEVAITEHPPNYCSSCRLTLWAIKTGSSVWVTWGVASQ